MSSRAIQSVLGTKQIKYDSIINLDIWLYCFRTHGLNYWSHMIIFIYLYISIYHLVALYGYKHICQIYTNLLNLQNKHTVLLKILLRHFSSSTSRIVGEFALNWEGQNLRGPYRWVFNIPGLLKVQTLSGYRHNKRHGCQYWCRCIHSDTAWRVCSM